MKIGDIKSEIQYFNKLILIEDGEIQENDHPFKLLANNIEDAKIANNNSKFSLIV